ncbi:MAG: cation-translocating P-type ATPase [Ruminococcus sp.]|jgi:Ca2+-transporting ATPase|nr:cation-translocating P-type ATPase [Ruminococcus sp.]
MNILSKPYTARTGIKGLSSEQAEELTREFGQNILAKKGKANPVAVFLGQFKDVMVIILLAATAVSVFLGEVYDAATIITIVLINAIIGFTQEYKTGKTLAALENMAAPTAKVYRDGEAIRLPAENLVPGDVIIIEAGDRIPADASIITSKSLAVEESILTGESNANYKESAGFIDTDNSIGKENILYMGTTAVKGTGEAQVVATGLATQMGKISGMLKDIDETETPLQKRLTELGKVIAIICMAVCVIVTAAGIIRGEPVLDMLMTGITIAIAAIPEGLPATVTIALALAVRRMLRKNALVHKLHSVETLGCAEVICTDKTGTVTENKMTVTEIYADGEVYNVSGTGYKQAGEITKNGLRLKVKNEKPLYEVLVCGALCENSRIDRKKPGGIAGILGSVGNSGNSGNSGSSAEFDTFGDPTETAILIAAAKGGVYADVLENEARRVDELPFESETRFMATLYRRGGVNNSYHTAYIKGAADVILDKCSCKLTEKGVEPLSAYDKRKITMAVDGMAASALRVLALAKKDTDSLRGANSGFVFLGLVGMIDPPRPEAKQAVKLCRSASVKTVMITGDHKDTAAAVARSAGILRGGNLILTGAELAVMSDDELQNLAPKTAVYARVSPADKLRIVRAYKENGKTVAMTGDGVNDAPAVKEADIGVAMGITGTDVTKQAADLVLLDDNFATLVSAVAEGRGIYGNIRKFVRYLLSCNIGEVLTMFLGIIMGMPMVLLPTQILLVNLATDGLPAVALGVEPNDPDDMKKPPRKAADSFFSGGLMGKIIFRGILIGLLTLGSFSTVFTLSGDITTARTAALLTLVLSQLMHVFECKSEKKNIFTVDYKNNPKLILAVLSSLIIIALAIFFPPAQLIFGTTALGITELLIALGFAVFAPILQCIFK